MKHGPLTLDTRIEVWQRDGGRCVRCGKEGSEVHHRQRRAVGGHGLHNLVLLCAACHHTEVHGNPERSRGEGFIVSAYSNAVDAVPVQTFRGLRYLNTDGSYSSD